MKNFITILLFFIPLVGLTQISGKAEYELIIGDDPRMLLRESDKEILRDIQHISSDLNFNLYFNNEFSFFKINQDNIDYNKYLFLFAIASTDPESICFSDLKNNNFSSKITSKFLDGSFIIEDTIDYQWKLTSEEKQINDFLVIKATGKNRKGIPVEAWFCPEIPISAGPENFMGLPGLILELQVEYTQYICKKIEFTDIYNPFIVKPTNAKILNFNSYDELVKERISFLRNQ